MGIIWGPRGKLVRSSNLPHGEDEQTNEGSYRYEEERNADDGVEKAEDLREMVG